MIEPPPPPTGNTHMPLPLPPRQALRRTHRRVVLALLATAAALAGDVVAGPGMIGGAQAADSPAGSPYGAAGHMWFHLGGMTFIGWTVDPSTPKAPINAYITVDNKIVRKV